MVPPVSLLECDRLDPRAANDAVARPIPDSVNIPLAELADRVHELPPRTVPLSVVGPPDVAAPAVRWLHEHGRAACLAPAADAESVPSGRAGPEAVVRRLWRPNPFLTRVAESLSEQHPPSDTPAALELACGMGRDAVFLASRGWKVTAIDHLPDALARAAALERRYRAGGPPIGWVRADLEGWALPVDARFDLIVGIRYLHRPLLRRLPELLRPGGRIVWETFTIQHRVCHGKPSRDAHLLKPGELPELFPGLIIAEYAEEWRDGAHLARVLAVRCEPSAPGVPGSAAPP